VRLKLLVVIGLLLLLVPTSGAVSYIVGSYTYETPGNIISGADDRMLFDGVKDSGNQVVLAVDFWGKNEEQSYLDLIWDFKAPVLIQYARVFGKNHTSSYLCRRVDFYVIAADGSEVLASTSPGSDNLLWNVQSDLIGLYGRYLKIRVFGYPGKRLNLEEIEADFIVYPNEPAMVSATRISLERASLSWQPSEPAADGKGASFYEVFYGQTEGFEPEGQPLLQTKATDCLLDIQSSAAYFAIYAVDFEGNRSLKPQRASLPAAGRVEGRITTAIGENLPGVRVQVLDKTATSNKEGYFTIEPLPVGEQLLTTSMVGYYTNSELITVKQGEAIYVTISLDAGIVEINAPANFLAQRLGATGAKLSWDPSGIDVKEYQIYRGESPLFSEARPIAKTQTTSWQDRELSEGSIFYFLTAISITEYESAPTAPVELIIPPLVAPKLIAPASGTVIAGLQQSVPGYVGELSWEAVGCSGYQVRIAGPGINIDERTADPYFVIPQVVLAKDAWYTWQVGAIYEEGIEAVFSPTSRFLVSNLPAEDVLAISQVGLSEDPYYPAKGDTFFRFSLSVPAEVTLSIYNLSGWLVFQQQQSGIRGVNEVRWDGMDLYGKMLRSGLYGYILTAARDGKSVIYRGNLLIRR
jgi:hypothetical protein